MAIISSIPPQVSSKVVGNGERSRIEALLVVTFDAEDLAEERLTSVVSIRQQETSAEEIVTFYSKLVCCTVSVFKKTAVYDTMEKSIS